MAKPMTAADEGGAVTESYNLLHEPWIPVIMTNGGVHKMSIRDVIKNAGEVRALSHELGTVNFALLRILLAILYRAWDNEAWKSRDNALDHWEEKWQQELLLDDQVESYFLQWEHRFDLRDTAKPFFQVADLHTSKDEWKNLSILIPDAGEGELFSMRSETDSISAAEAACLLVHCMAYDFSGIKSGAVGDERVKGGKGYPIGIGWAGWLGGTTVEGDTLKETLLLNYVPHRSEAGSGDLPAWELDPLTAAPRNELRFIAGHPERNASTGQVDLLTWQQRRIRLRWEGSRVNGVLISNGDPVGYTVQHGIETMTPWRFSDPQTKKMKKPVYMARTLDPDRALWRSLSGILPHANADKVKSKFGDNISAREPAQSVLWVGDLIDSGILPPTYVFNLREISIVYGAQSASYKDIAEDSLTLRSPLLALNGRLIRSIALRAVAEAETVANHVGNFYRNVIFAVSGEESAETSLIRGKYFSRIDHEFRNWIRDLPEYESPNGALETWRAFLKTSALSLADEVLAAQGPSVWIGRWKTDKSQRVTGANSYSWLKSALRRLLEPTTYEKEESDEAI